MNQPRKNHWHIFLSRGFAFLMATVMCIPLLGVASATFIGESAIDFKDEEVQIQNSVSLSDEEKVSQLAELYLTAHETEYMSDAPVTLANFFTEEEEIEEMTMDRLFKLQKAIRDHFDYTYLYEDYDITINDVEVSGNNAVVNAYEYRECRYADRPDILSTTGIEFTITFTNSDGDWKITDVTSNDEMLSFVDNNKGIDEIIEDFTTPAPVPTAEELRTEMQAQQEAEAAIAVNSAATTTLYNYDPDLAVEYALEYTSNSSGTSSYNPLFPNYPNTDCMNFVSQCIWYGCGGSNTANAVSNSLPPMVASGEHAWYSTAYGCTNSWSSNGFFIDHINSRETFDEGVVATLNNLGSYSVIYDGDLLQHNPSGVEDTWNYEHIYIVTDTNQTGSATIPMTNEDIWVSAHTANRHNNRLSEIFGESKDTLRRISVGGVRVAE